MSPSLPRDEPAGHGFFQRIRLLALGTLIVAGSLRGLAQMALPPSSELKKFSVDQLMDLEVTSVSKRPEKLFEAALAIQVITDEDIRRSGATSLPEALRLASNLEVAQIDSRQWAITARGFNNLFADKMLVLMDGRTVYTPLYAGVYWDVQDTLLADLDRIEVISGPGATQWGANAVNGVINITTKSAQDTQGGLVTATAGHRGRLGGSPLRRAGGARRLLPGLRKIRLARRVHAHHQRHRGEDEWRLTQGGFRLDAGTAASNQFTLQGDLYAGTFGRPGPDGIEANGSNLLGRWSRDLGDGADLRLQVYYDHTHRKIPGSFTQTLDTYDTDFSTGFSCRGSGQEIVWGFAYRLVDDDIVNTPANAFFAATGYRAVVQRLPAGWNRAERQPAAADLRRETRAQRLHGLRSRTDRAGGVDAGSEAHGVDGGVAGRAHAFAHRPAICIRRPRPPYRVAGGPNVVSENVLAYELGYRQQLTSRLSLALAGFYNDYDDLRSSSR
ncbi:MAG: TonB-dependent receptor plug domain-containing protein [Lacunisphaera sp.]